MSGKWEKTFEIAVPVERVWEAFTNPDELKLLLGPPADSPIQREPGEGLQVLEAVPMKKLRWSQERGDLPEKAEFSVSFESTDTGSSITVTRFGFGEGEDADIFSVSNGLGFEHGIRDMILYLETGQLVKRHYDGCTLSCLGMSYVETPGGIEVRRVGGEGVAAEAGLERGDRLVRIGRLPIYTRADVWLTNGIHEPDDEVEVEFIRGGELMRATGRAAPIAARLVGE
jgi:uncharacterized protein YndB with AHSA1/START domain